MLRQDREAALLLRDKLCKFVEAGNNADDALWDAAASVKEMIGLLNEMHQLGQAAPTSEQLRINATTAIKSMLQELPQSWVGDLEFMRLAPNQKKRFKDLCAGWQEMIERSLAQRLGEDKPEKVEAA